MTDKLTPEQRWKMVKFKSIELAKASAAKRLQTFRRVTAKIAKRENTDKRKKP